MEAYDDGKVLILVKRSRIMFWRSLAIYLILKHCDLLFALRLVVENYFI